ncbi:MAG: hypothetical protein K9H64_15100 [Bacteroidales bacterium]|nr:hypothetical protein [Bacteroidales bacterium]MCF8457301.1 hypothetical protein [Bacteroidales bacterium]
MTDLKSKIIKGCLAQQQKLAETAKAEMQKHQKMANDYGAPKDRYDAFRNQMLRKRDQFAKQYQRALEDIQILEKIDPKINCEKAEFGAVVITNAHKLFISISLGKITVDGQDYFAISAKVPIYNAIEDLKKDDEFQFNGKKFKLLDVF